MRFCPQTAGGREANVQVEQVEPIRFSTGNNKRGRAMTRSARQIQAFRRTHGRSQHFCPHAPCFAPNGMAIDSGNMWEGIAMRNRSDGRRFCRRGFTFRDLVALTTCLVLAVGLLVPLLGTGRDLSKATICTANLHTWFAALSNYVSTYNSYPPHNPYPQYYSCPTGVPGLGAYGWDPLHGWLMTYGMGLTPPATIGDVCPDVPPEQADHFAWFVADLNEYPFFCFCPAANFHNLFEPNPEIGEPPESALENFVFQYAACYQVSAICRAATPVIRQINEFQTLGGRNPVIPDPRSRYVAQPADNAQGGVPYVYVLDNAGEPTDPSAGYEEMNCWIQAVHPSEVEAPARLYYMADSRDYRPTPPGTLGSFWPAGNSDGWRSAFGNKVFLGSRHFGYANALYLDGHVSRENQTHIVRWNMDYDPETRWPRSDQWRCATFATDIRIALIRTQVHTMPVLMVEGWEQIFGPGGVIPR